MKESKHYSSEPISRFVRKDQVALNKNLKVSETLDYIRTNVTNDSIIYFYIVDEEQKLLGVVSTRKLLTSDLDLTLEEIMDVDIKYIPCGATVFDIWSEFVIHKYLALPVVDDDKCLVGVVDINVFTDNVNDVFERSQTDEAFETIGFKISQVQNASPLRVFRFRFPWLSATLASGIACALMTSRYELVLSQSIILAFFLTLVLGLGESVSTQSMTVTIQTLRNVQPTLGGYFVELFKEFQSAVMLGVACGSTVTLSILIWKGFANLMPALVIGGSLIATISIACLIGLTIPYFLHLLKLDLRIASGPLTLALADIFTIIIYFSVASLVL